MPSGSIRSQPTPKEAGAFGYILVGGRLIAREALNVVTASLVAAGLFLPADWTNHAKKSVLDRIDPSAIARTHILSAGLDSAAIPAGIAVPEFMPKRAPLALVPRTSIPVTASFIPPESPAAPISTPPPRRPPSRTVSAKPDQEQRSVPPPDEIVVPGLDETVITGTNS